MGACCIINLNFNFDYNCNLLSCGRFDLESGHAADCASAAALQRSAQNERLRQRTCFDCRTLQNGKFATQSTTAAAAAAVAAVVAATRTATATHTNCFNCNKFFVLSHPLEFVPGVSVESSSTHGVEIAESQQLLDEVKHPQLEICPTLESCPHPFPRHDEQRFGHACWAFLRIQLQIRLQLVLVLHSGLDRTGSNANSTLQHGLSN